MSVYKEKKKTFAAVDMSQNLQTTEKEKDFIEATNLNKKTKKLGRPKIDPKFHKSANIMVNITQERREALKEIADKNNISISAVVNFAITLYLEVQNKK